MDSTARFALACRDFCTWARGGDTDDPVHTALRLLAELVATAALLPNESDARPADDHYDIQESEWDAVHIGAARLPFQYYTETLEPLDPTSESVGIGDIADDIADTYAEVLPGLRLFDEGEPERAAQHWLFGFRTHWGDHATSATLVLHRYSRR
jgi:hypothetical protein